jgi:hypothetical protein
LTVIDFENIKQLNWQMHCMTIRFNQWLLKEADKHTNFHWCKFGMKHAFLKELYTQRRHCSSNKRILFEKIHRSRWTYNIQKPWLIQLFWFWGCLY